MSGDAQWLIEAIEQMHVVEYRNGQDFVLLEPYIYARVPGKGDAVIGYQVPRQRVYHSAPEGGWIEIAASELSRLAKAQRFASSRTVPQHLRARAIEVYCEVTVR